MRFDHCYQMNRSEDVILKLADRGFSLDEKTVEHPGELICRFIKFKKNNEASKRGHQYLEFAHVRNPAMALADQPAGTPESKIWEPGFSLTTNESLNQIFETQKENFKPFEPNLTHKNYDWKSDSTSHLPGWNFLVFGKPVVEDLFIWCTEYDPRPDVYGVSEIPRHPNTVDFFHGFIWDISANDAINLASASGCPISNNTVALDDGSEIYLEKREPIFKDKTTPFNAVVLTCGNWDQFCHHARPDRIIEWRGKKAGVIQMDSGSWDILVIESEI